MLVPVLVLVLELEPPPKTYFAPTTASIKAKAAGITAGPQVLTPEQMKERENWFEAKSNLLVVLLLSIKNDYGFVINDENNQLVD